MFELLRDHVLNGGEDIEESAEVVGLFLNNFIWCWEKLIPLKENYTILELDEFYVHFRAQN